MSSSEVLEGKITQVLEREPHKTQKGKETTRQVIVLSKDGKAIKITCYGVDDMNSYRGADVRISGLSESFKKDGSYMANYQTEFDDRVDSDPTEEHQEDIEMVKSKEYQDGERSAKTEPLTKWTPASSELSKFSITVTRSKDYQSITISEEFTGSFKEIVNYWEELNKQALLLLGRMPKL